MTNRNLKYLKEEIFPFLREMPTIEQLADGEASYMSATLDFDEYWIDEMGKPITNEYSCGRAGCLAGWYVMISEQEGRLTDEELVKLKDKFSERRLGEHFGIDRFDAVRLFGSKDHGFKQPNHYNTAEILADREEFLDQLLDSTETER